MKRCSIVCRLFATLVTLMVAVHGLSAQIRVACIGDSVTEGYLLKDPETESYPAQLQDLLGSGYVVGNFGHSGATLLRKGHTPYFKQKKFGEALAFKADIAVIHLGLNDTDPRDFPHYRDEFVKDYVWLIDTLLSTNPRMKVYVCSMTPIFTGHRRYSSSTKEWYGLLQEEIRKVVKAEGAGFIDLYEVFKHRPDLFPDQNNLHPDKKGAGVLARTVFGHLTGDYGGLSVRGTWGDDMVLQQNAEATISGLADAGSKVTLALDGKTVGSFPVSDDGKWCIGFKTGKGSFDPHVLTVTDGKTTKTFRNVRFGEVWFALGQSNMDFALRQAEGGETFAKENGSDKDVSYLMIKPLALPDDNAWSRENLERANDLDFNHGEWTLPTPDKAREFSAIGYPFGVYLEKALNVPVGIIQFAIGGSPLMSWVSRESLTEDPLFHTSFNGWMNKDFIMRWCRDRAKKNLKNTDFPYQRHSYDPAFNYEAGLLQLRGLPVAGALWYQGESDTENAELHNRLFPLFYGDLESLFGDNLPLLVVQLSSLERPSFPRFRDAQRRLADKYPNIDLAISYDLGKHGDVHPTRKLPIAERLTRLALQEKYGRTLEYAADAPMPASLIKEGDAYMVTFEKSRGLLSILDGSDEVKGFKFVTLKGDQVAAKASVSRDRRSVRVEVPGGIDPVSLVYAFDMYTDANLGYEGGQPVSTFILPVDK